MIRCKPSRSSNVVIASSVMIIGAVALLMRPVGCSQLMFEWYGFGEGNLGVGDVTAHPAPISVWPRTTGIRLIAGPTTTFILAGEVLAFGANNYGQLGLGDNVTRYYPTALFPLVSRIAAGSTHTLLGSYKQLYVFGSNEYGQLGLGTNDAARFTPTLGMNISSSYYISEVAAGESHSIVLVVSNDGYSRNEEVYVFGDNRYGQLGLGDNVARNTPTLMQKFTNGVYKVHAGFTTSFIQTEKKRYQYAVLSWGRGEFGALGLGDFADRSTPTLLMNGTSPLQATDVSAGGNHVIISASSYDFPFTSSFGSNVHGQLGLGDTVNRCTPTLIEYFEDYINDASAGVNHSIVNYHGEAYVFGAAHLEGNHDLLTPTYVMNGFDRVSAGGGTSFVEIVFGTPPYEPPPEHPSKSYILGVVVAVATVVLVLAALGFCFHRYRESLQRPSLVDTVRALGSSIAAALCFRHTRRSRFGSNEAGL